jgi:hypothetical protein
MTVEDLDALADAIVDVLKPMKAALDLRATALDARLRAVEAAIGSRTLLCDGGGVFDATKYYNAGAVVQKDGSSWIAKVNGPRSEPGTGGTDWRLLAQRGPRGRDGR